MTNLSLVSPIFAYDVWLLLQIAVGHGTENVKVNVDNTSELGETGNGGGCISVHAACLAVKALKKNYPRRPKVFFNLKSP